jgi:hypothetical protein
MFLSENNRLLQDGRELGRDCCRSSSPRRELLGVGLFCHSVFRVDQRAAYLALMRIRSFRGAAKPPAQVGKVASSTLERSGSKKSVDVFRAARGNHAQPKSTQLSEILEYALSLL